MAARGPRQLDAHVREIVAWHFDRATGSPYWLERAPQLDFNPLTDIHGYADLRRFPAAADDWRRASARDLIPRGCKGPFNVWETGGTTGPPGRIIDGEVRSRGLKRISRMLDGHSNFPGPGGGDWLSLAPGGPHLVGTNVRLLARHRRALCHSIDLDPRWIKSLYRDERHREARRYVEHIVEQARAVLENQPIEVVAATPPLLQALCENPSTYHRLRAGVRGVIWFGTSMSDETVRLLENELLPDAGIVGWYGNTMMGIACQRPRQPEDSSCCIFTPPSPQAVVQLVDQSDPAKMVSYGEEGRVRLSLLNRELFLPWHLERDLAIRVPPAVPGGWDGLARVRPLDGGGPQSEGVY